MGEYILFLDPWIYQPSCLIFNAILSQSPNIPRIPRQLCWILGSDHMVPIVDRAKRNILCPGLWLVRFHAWCVLIGRKWCVNKHSWRSVSLISILIGSNGIMLQEFYWSLIFGFKLSMVNDDDAFTLSKIFLDCYTSQTVLDSCYKYFW